MRGPATDAQRRYNASHIRTRNLIERTIGVLKKRFACLSSKLHYSPQKVGEFVVTCCILHNYALQFADVDEDDNDILIYHHVDGQIPPVNNIAGIAFRNAFIQQHFV